MCGRMTMSVEFTDLESYLTENYKISNIDNLNYKKRYNIAPSNDVLAIICDGIKNRIGYLKWGFIPEFSNDEKMNFINARSETVASKLSFKSSFIHKRCIIPINSFYEWQNKDNTKTPMRILMKDEGIFALAGLWSTYIKPDNSRVYTFTILTTKANNLISNIHERMPVIIPIEKVDLWLKPNNKDINSLNSLLLPFSEELMTYYPVSNEVNNPRNDYEDLIKKANQ